MDYIKSGLKLINGVRDVIGTDTCESISTSESGSLSGVWRIPFETLTDDGQLLSIVKEFGLDNPENMIRFVVESFFAAIDSIQDETGTLKDILVGNDLGSIEGARRMIIHGLSNSNVREEKLKYAQNVLSQVEPKLEKKVESFISEIQAIDNQPKWKFFVHAKTSLKIIDSNIALIKKALNAIDWTVALQIMISKDFSEDITGSVIDPYKRFYSQLDVNTIALLNDYDKDKRDGYFLQITGRPEKTIALKDTYQCYLEEVSEVEV